MLLTSMVCVVSFPVFRSACVSWTLCCVCELSRGCLSAQWKPEPGRGECCLYSSISSSSRLAKIPAWVCVLLQGCVAKLCSTLYMMILFTWGVGGWVGPLDLQGLSRELVRGESKDGERVGGVRWGAKLQSHPFFEKLLLPHSANSPQLYRFSYFWSDSNMGL